MQVVQVVQQQVDNPGKLVALLRSATYFQLLEAEEAEEPRAPQMAQLELRVLLLGGFLVGAQIRILGGA